METNSPPVLPIISPCEMYFRRSALILPRTICLNRLASRSIFRTTALVPRRGGGRRPPVNDAGRPRAQHASPETGAVRPVRKSKDPGETVKGGCGSEAGRKGGSALSPAVPQQQIVFQPRRGVQDFPSVVASRCAGRV